MSLLINAAQIVRSFPTVTATELVMKSVEPRMEFLHGGEAFLIAAALVTVLEKVFEKPMNHLYAKAAFSLEKHGHKMGGKAGIALIMAAEVLHHTTEEEKPEELKIKDLYRRAAWNIQNGNHHILSTSSHAGPKEHKTTHEHKGHHGPRAAFA